MDVSVIRKQELLAVDADLFRGNEQTRHRLEMFERRCWGRYLRG